jgi:phosphate transport system protein
MHTHIEESLQHDIDRIRENIDEMSCLAEKALHDCLQAYTKNDRQLAYAVILRDQYIDEKEKEIDRLCLEFIIRQQPIAGHLRFAFSTIKINLELERVGDYAESVARHIVRFADPVPEKLREGIVKLGGLSIGMFHDSVRAFLDQDIELARKSMAVEETADALRSDLYAMVGSICGDKSIPFQMVEAQMTIIKRFERVADQARDICMETLYMCTGENIKHPGAEAFRVLFIDENNSCRSQMAEAIANSFDQPRFIFSSAGIEPLPISSTTIEFMKKKGFDLSRAAPKGIHQIPNLDHYQVVVVLAKEVHHKAFPQRPGKIVFIDWHIKDPSKAKGTAEEVEALYEKALQFLRTQLQDLIGAIIGSEPGKEKGTTCS